MKFLTIIFLFALSNLSAQTLIKGKVIDKNQKAIPLANVYLEGTYDGTTTDSLGNFAFETNSIGSNILKVSALGMNPFSISIASTSQEPLIIKLIEEHIKLEEVLVPAGMMQANNSGKNSVMSALDIATTAGSMGNIVQALATLPGAQILGENGRLMVHGGEANETQTYINGLRVPQPYTSTTSESPARGRFSPVLFSGVNFSTGGYSAVYGNALSSILSLHTSPKIENPKADLSFSSIGLGLSNTSRWKNSSVSLNTNYTNLKPYSEIIQQKINWTKPYESLSGEMIYKHQFPSAFLNVYVSYSFENMGLKQEDINYSKEVNVKKETKNSYLNVDYQHDLGHRWQLNSGISYGYLSDQLHYGSTYIPNSEKALHLQEKVSKSWSNSIKSSFGFSYFDTDFREELQQFNQTIRYGYHTKVAALFTETTIAIVPNLIANLGIRGTFANLQTKNMIEPRISLGYIPKIDHQFSIAYGDFHQQARQDILKFEPTLDWAAAKHYIFNYLYNKNGKIFRIEAYKKKYEHLVKYDTPTANYNSQYQNNGSGKVAGLDLFYKDSGSIRNFQYWLSYAFTDSKRNEANYSSTVTAPYVYKHSFSFVGKYWISAIRSQISVTNTVLSGRNYHDPNADMFMSGKTKGYNNLSTSWSYLISQQKIIHLAVSNILGASPIYGYQYADKVNSAGQYAHRAIEPAAKRFVFVGYFWTINKDKSDNQLKNL